MIGLEMLESIVDKNPEDLKATATDSQSYDESNEVESGSYKPGAKRKSRFIIVIFGLGFILWVSLAALYSLHMKEKGFDSIWQLLAVLSAVWAYLLKSKDGI